MNWLTHYLVGVALLRAFGTDFSTALIGGLVALTPDLDFIACRGKRERTWFQEPISILLIGLPLGLIAQQFHPAGILLTVVHASHIILDYLSHHEVKPLAPFSRTTIIVGIIKPFPCPKRFRGRAGLNESALLLMAIAAILYTFL